MVDQLQPAAAHRVASLDGEAALTTLTAVILNWNQPDFTIRAADGLVEDGLSASRIVVVDNGSTDGSWERFQGSLRGCHLVRVAANLGFAGGNNLGAEALPGSCYLFVNSDAFVHRSGSVAELVRALDAEAVGLVVPRLLNEDLTLQATVVPSPTPGVALVRSSGLSRMVPNRLQPEWSVYWDHGHSREIQGAIGAVMLVRGAVWNELRGFRETSFMYAEDIDLCWRVVEGGRRVWFAAEAEFVHLGGASTSWDHFDRGERIARAEAAMIREHLSPARARLTNATLRAGYAARYAYRKARGHEAVAAECAGRARGYGSRLRTEDTKQGRPQPEIAVLRPGARSEVLLTSGDDR